MAAKGIRNACSESSHWQERE